MERSGFLHVRKEDIRRVAITCRCGVRFVVEVPQQVVQADNMGVCPGCQALFMVHQHPDKTWHIERTGATTRDVVAYASSLGPNDCQFCAGSGKLAGGRCGHCGGSGKLKVSKQ